MAARGPAGSRAAVTSRFAQFKLVLLGMWIPLQLDMRIDTRIDTVDGTKADT